MGALYKMLYCCTIVPCSTSKYQFKVLAFNRLIYTKKRFQGQTLVQFPRKVIMVIIVIIFFTHPYPSLLGLIIINN